MRLVSFSGFYQIMMISWGIEGDHGHEMGYPIFSQCYISVSPENVRKPKVFGPFQGVQKWNIGRIWVNKVLVFYSQKNEKDDVMQPDILSSFFSF